jgi:hypothetical protein
MKKLAMALHTGFVLLLLFWLEAGVAGPRIVPAVIQPASAPATKAKHAVPAIAIEGAAAQGPVIQPQVSVLQSNARPLLTGYDSVTGEMRGTCVKYNGTIPPFDSKGPQSGALQLDQGHSLEQFFEKQNLSAQASMGIGGFKADASYQMMETHQINSYSEYLRVSTYVNYQPYQIDLQRVDWAPFGDNYRKDPTPGSFYKYCGDSFIVGQLNGANFSAVYTASSTTTHDQSSSSATLAGSYTGLTGGGSGSVSMQTQIDDLTSTGRLQLFMLRVGANEKYPDAAPKDIFAYAQNYSKNVSDSGLVWTLSYITRRYDEVLTGVPKTTPPPGDDDSAAQAEATYERRIAQRISDLSYMLDPNNWKQFADFDHDKARKEVDDLSTKLASRRENFECIMQKGVDKCPYDKHTVMDIKPVPGRPNDITSIDPNSVTPFQIASAIGDNRIAVSVTGRWNGCVQKPPTIPVCMDWPANGGSNLFYFQSRKDFTLRLQQLYYAPMLVPKDSDVYFGIDHPMVGVGAGKNASDQGDPLTVHVFEPLYPEDYPSPAGSDQFDKH